MPFSATINLGTVGVAITSVKLYGCTGTSGGNCTGCTALTGYENVSVSTFPLLVNGIPNGVTYIQAEALGACSADLVKQCISISGIPGATPAPTSTPTPTPTGTSAPGATPNPTSTQTQTPTPTPTPSTTSDTTPNPTSTQTPTPTPTITSDCVTSVQFEVDTGGDVRYVDCCGNTEYVNVGAGPEVINGCIQNGSLFQVGASIRDISYGGSPCSCIPAPTPSPSPSATPSYYSITVNLQGMIGQNGNLQVYQSADGISYQSSLTLTSNDGDYASSGFNGTPGYWYYLIVARTSGGSGMNDVLNLYTQVGLTDFSPGPINGAWCDSNANTLQSDPFQLPNPIQGRQSIIFYGGLNEGCL